jgi:hypothetical protein
MLVPEGQGTRSQVLLEISAAYSSSIARRQFGSARALRWVLGMGERVVALNAVGKRKPDLLRVVIPCWLTTGVMGTAPAGNWMGAGATGASGTGRGRRWYTVRGAAETAAGAAHGAGVGAASEAARGARAAGRAAGAAHGAGVAGRAAGAARGAGAEGVGAMVVDAASSEAAHGVGIEAARGWAARGVGMTATVRAAQRAEASRDAHGGRGGASWPRSAAAVAGARGAATATGETSGESGRVPAGEGSIGKIDTSNSDKKSRSVDEAREPARGKEASSKIT